MDGYLGSALVALVHRRFFTRRCRVPSSRFWGHSRDWAPAAGAPGSSCRVEASAKHKALGPGAANCRAPSGGLVFPSGIGKASVPPLWGPTRHGYFAGQRVVILAASRLPVALGVGLAVGGLFFIWWRARHEAPPDTGVSSGVLTLVFGVAGSLLAGAISGGSVYYLTPPPPTTTSTTTTSVTTTSTTTSTTTVTIVPVEQDVSLVRELTPVASNDMGTATTSNSIARQQNTTRVGAGFCSGCIDVYGDDYYNRWIEYNLAGRYSRLKTTAGQFDDSRDTTQVVRLRVLVDGRVLFSQEARFNEASPLDLDLSRGNRLRLEVTLLASKFSNLKAGFGDPTLVR